MANETSRSSDSSELGIDPAEQDALDGEALRRLIEAAGGYPHITIEAGDDPIEVDLNHSAFGRGSTIAEAADKCREALEGKE